MNETLTFKVIVDAEAESVTSYHEKKRLEHRLLPPWEIESLPLIHEFKKISETHTEVSSKLEGNYSLKKKKQIQKAVAYRHRLLQEDLKHFASAKRAPLKVLISGAHGFVGSHLCLMLEMFGDEVWKLVRKPYQEANTIYWDPEKEQIESHSLEGFDVVIHLSGEPITKTWTLENKQKMYQSRVNITRWLTHALNQLNDPPKLFLCASACGFYGDRKEEKLDEHSAKGKGFLSEIVEDWERSAGEFIKGRVVYMRFGTVIGIQGGMLKEVMRSFKMGCGAILGKGTEWMSWISLDDLCYSVLHVMARKHLQGAVNFTTPYPVTAKDFSHALAKVLRRPLLLKIPRWLVGLLFGEKGRALLLSSIRAFPAVLMQSGYTFAYSRLSEALALYLGR